MSEAARNDELLRLWRSAQFVLSGARLPDLPRGGREVAFAGRSNAGKSSALNVLTDQKSLARTSKTPGRTQLLNLFTLGDLGHLVDLPGYGFAAAPLAVKKQWVELIERYFIRRDELAAVVMIVDVRRGITDLDQQLLNWVGPRFLPVHVLLSKADKLSKNEAQKQLFKVQKQLKAQNPLYSAQLFSATAKLGVEEARLRVDELFNGAIESP
ncbi:MAG: ribosome biogenesis GTP-binding protein YihA/YsxC [Oceanococcus sp.]